MCPADEDDAPAVPSEATPARSASEGISGTVSWAWVCDPGTARDNNEDFAGALAAETGEQPALFVVADGMGGHAAGEVASQLAVETTLANWAAGGSGSAPQKLRAAVRAANVAVFDASQEAARRGMGSTLTALVLAGREVVIAHVGDSRAYLIRGGQASQLTADHSKVGEMLRMRLITAEQAARHPARSMLTRSLGTEPILQIDLIRQAAEVGDAYVLCSDGLWDSVARAEIAEIVTRGVPGPAASTGDKATGDRQAVGAPTTVNQGADAARPGGFVVPSPDQGADAARPGGFVVPSPDQGAGAARPGGFVVPSPDQGADAARPGGAVVPGPDQGADAARTAGQASPSPGQVAVALIELALKRDAPDNVTVVVIRLLAHGREAPPRRLFRRRGA